MASDRIAEQVSGVVTCANPNGFKVEGRDGWLNFSKYADTPLTPPEVGQRVQVGLDKGGFVRQVVMSSEPIEAALPIRQQAHQDDRQQAPAPEVVADAGLPGREVLIVRQSSLKAAVELHGSVAYDGPRGVDALLELAEQFETWVTRPRGEQKGLGE
jgi:hypothetical protein